MATKAPKKPLLTEGRAESLREVLQRIPEHLVAEPETAQGMRFLADLVAWRLADATKEKRKAINREIALSPSGMTRYTGLGRGRRKGDKLLATDSTNS